ncbi:MAG: zinc-ribbon and DUF3426 domain-containing protein [Xanthomonadales bacterium]|nr:zinc-ribbon and DUF3426 domain-containing protein [Xanthomonadales bacterium]
MFTRCPQCKTVHPLSAALISHGRGLVECGQCGRSFSSLSFLFDEWPSGEAHRPANGPDFALPVLGPTGKDDTVSDATSSDSDEPGPSRMERRQLVWILATVLLAVLTLAHIAWTFRQPLLENSRVSSWFKQNDSVKDEQQGLLKDPQQIKLVSRDMHTHPTRSGILVLSLTFVNLAQHNQKFPELEITLMDAANQPVAQRRLQPVHYLRPGADIQAGLAADVYLPVLLELGDPGDQAVGFEIQFL